MKKTKSFSKITSEVMDDNIVANSLQELPVFNIGSENISDQTNVNAITFRVDRYENGRFAGWAICDTHPTIPCKVDVQIDGHSYGIFAAESYREDLEKAAISDGKAGFSFDLSYDGRKDDDVFIKLFFIHSSGAVASWTRPANEIYSQKKTIWIDFSDLIQYFMHNRLPTGIQRVQLELARAALVNSKEKFILKAVFFNENLRFWCELDINHVVNIAEKAGNIERISKTEWDKIYGDFSRSFSNLYRAAFYPYDYLLNIGSSWWLPDYIMYVRHLQEVSQVRYIPFIYDCIPMITPEHCSSELVEDFEKWFSEVLEITKYQLVISECTGNDVRSFSQSLGFGETKTSTIRLDALSEPSRLLPRIGSNAIVSKSIASLGVVRPFVLFVGTLEVRKNHLAVFECWRNLLKVFGPEKVPTLVCVGKKGWLIDYTLNWLATRSDHKDYILLLSDISDMDLARLYSRAQFTVYSSFYEGWGLPVTESLCAGKVPIIPHHSSLPEAGGEYAIYYQVDGSRPTLQEVLENVILNPDLLRNQEALIKTTFRPRSWINVLDDILISVDDFDLVVGKTAVNKYVFSLERGVTYSIGRNRKQTQANGRLLEAPSLRTGFGWWYPESWGCWTRDPIATLAYCWPEDMAEQSSAYICLRCGPKESILTLSGPYLKKRSVRLIAGERKIFRLEIFGNPKGGDLCELEIHTDVYKLSDFIQTNDTRAVGVGVEIISVCNDIDVSGRLNVHEYLAF